MNQKHCQNIFKEIVNVNLMVENVIQFKNEMFGILVHVILRLIMVL